MKIIKIKIGLRGNEFFEVLKQVAKLVNNHDVTKLKIKTDYDGLVILFDPLEKGLEKEKGNALTKELNDLDHDRDDYYTGFVMYVEAMTYHPDAKIAAAAESLLHFLKGFGKNIIRTPQLAETTILNSIVHGINDDATRKTFLSTIGGEEWLAAIDAKNTEFAAKYSTRVVDDTDEKNVESFSSVRRRATAAYENLTEMLISRYRAEKADGHDVSNFVTCINEVNELIEKANILVATSKPHTAPPTTPTTPTTPVHTV